MKLEEVKAFLKENELEPERVRFVELMELCKYHSDIPQYINVKFENEEYWYEYSGYSDVDKLYMNMETGKYWFEEISFSVDDYKNNIYAYNTNYIEMIKTINYWSKDDNLWKYAEKVFNKKMQKIESEVK